MHNTGTVFSSCQLAELQLVQLCTAHALSSGTRLLTSIASTKPCMTILCQCALSALLWTFSRKNLPKSLQTGSTNPHQNRWIQREGEPWRWSQQLSVPGVTSARHSWEIQLQKQEGSFTATHKGKGQSAQLPLMKKPQNRNMPPLTSIHPQAKYEIILGRKNYVLLMNKECSCYAVNTNFGTEYIVIKYAFLKCHEAKFYL